MAKQTFKVNYNGTEITRTTERAYTHAVVGTGKYSGKLEASWCGSLVLAGKRKGSMKDHEDVQILEVPQITSPKVERKVVNGTQMNTCSICKHCEEAGSLKEGNYFVKCTGQCTA